MSDDNLRIIVLEQQTFIDKFEKLSPNLSKTLKEYITENNLSNPSSENYQKIFQHANGLSPDSASQGTFTLTFFYFSSFLLLLILF